MADLPLNNENYDVVSVLYHLLQGAETIEKYCQDSKIANDKELSSFFREVQDSNCKMAEKAQQILKQRLQ